MLKIFKTFILLVVLSLSTITPFHLKDKGNDSFKFLNTIYAEDESFTVIYDFVEYANLDGGKLPDEINKLVPEKQICKNEKDIELPKYDKSIAGYEFVGWEPGVKYEDGTLLFFGAWKKQEATKAIPRPDRPADKKITSGNTPVGIPGSGAPHQQLDSEDAYCYEPHVSGFGNPTHSYWVIDEVSGKAANIIGVGQINGMPYGAIQAALWNYLTGGLNYSYPGYEVDPEADVYSSKGRYDCSATIYASYVTDEGALQDLIMSSGCTLRATQGKLNLKKTAASTTYNYLSNSPNNYSLSGAEYGIYTDSSCTNKIATLTTDASGNSNSVDLDIGTYYVKETKASPGFRIDTKVHTAYVSLNNTTTISSLEDPIDDPINLVLTKTSSLDGYYIENLDQAEFTVRYYDTQANSISGLSPKYTWVFKPIMENGKAILRLDKSHYLRGDALILGSGNTLRIPLGVFTIEETKAPQYYARDTQIYLGKNTNNNGSIKTTINGGQSLKVENLQLTQTEEPQTVSISVEKLDYETGLAKAQGIGTLKGAEFTVKKLNSNNQKEIVGKIITDENGYGKLEKDNNNKKLLPGKYYVQETKAPDGYVLNNEEVEIDAKIKEANTANFDYKVSIKDKVTQIKVLKVDSKGNEISGAELQLLDEDENVVYSWTSDSTPHIIKGLIVDHQYTLHEKAVRPNYMLAEDKTISVADEKPKDFVMVDQNIIIHTNATFKENGKKNYVADGIAHIIDEVEYENLYMGRNYLLKGELIDKESNEVLMEITKEFSPTRKNGVTELEFEFNLDDYDNHDFVVFETLYIINEDEQRIEVVDHKDINDKGQTVHIDELYRADLLILKIDGETKQTLDDVEFEISYKRTKKDNSLEEKNLGTFKTVDGLIEIPKFKKDSIVYIKELSAPEGYHVDPKPIEVNIGHDEKIKVIEKTIENYQIRIGTYAKFKETNSKNYVADGIAHIIDTVSYEWLQEGQEYILKGELIDKGKDNTKQDVVAKATKKFIPDKTHGTIEVEFIFNLDNYDEHDFVVFEELYTIIDGEEIKVTEHKDIDDKGQTIHVDKLYKCAMVLYKIGQSKEIKLNGAIFKIETTRTKVDGTIVKKDLGHFISGGIYVEDSNKFTFELAKDKDMSDIVHTYSSKHHPMFNNEYVMIDNISPGKYYGRIKGTNQIKEYVVEQGMIYLPDQIENTSITYTEIYAPQGYYLSKDPYTVNVGNNHSLTRIDNYRKNVAIFIPKTGV